MLLYAIFLERAIVLANLTKISMNRLDNNLSAIIYLFFEKTEMLFRTLPGYCVFISSILVHESNLRMIKAMR